MARVSTHFPLMILSFLIACFCFALGCLGFKLPCTMNLGLKNFGFERKLKGLVIRNYIVIGLTYMLK